MRIIQEKKLNQIYPLKLMNTMDTEKDIESNVSVQHEGGDN